MGITGQSLARVETEPPAIQRLIARAQQGDGESFCALYRHYDVRLLGQAAAFCGDRMLAEDLVQDALFESWKSIRRYNGRCRFYTWLCAILLNRCRKVIRRKHPFAISTLPGIERDGVQSLLDCLPAPDSRPDQTTVMTERDAFVQKCLHRLSNKHREVVYLRFYVDTSMESIAAALSCSVGTVKSRLFHALEKLRIMKDLRGHYQEDSTE